MLKKALLSALVLGATSTAALAAPVRHEEVRRTPVVTRDHRDADRDRDFHQPIDRGPRAPEHWRNDIHPIVRERVERRVFAPTYVYETSSYTSPFVNGQEWLSLGGVAGRAIELTANGGSTYVQQITIQFADGRSEVMPIGQTLDAGNPQLTVPTDGCAVSGVSVIGWGTGVSAFAV